MTVLGHEIGLSITLVSPFATRGLVTDRASLDVPLARDPQNRYILPATLVTGVLRAALARLARAAPGAIPLDGETRPLAEDLDLLFGVASTNDSRPGEAGWRVANEPRRALLLLDDLCIDETGLERLPADRRDYARIQLDKELGAVREGFLQFIELPFAIGREVTFKGRAYLRRGAIGPARARSLIGKALGLVPAIGGIKASGFGRVAGFRVEPPAAITVRRSQAPDLALDLDYEIDRPFLVGGRMAGGNLFVGDRIVPGAAIKGTLANALADARLMTPAMAAFLAELVVGHAFPKPIGHAGQPWRPIPLSLALAGDNYLVDRLHADPVAPIVLEGNTVAVVFPPDMKDDASVHAYLGQGWDLPELDIRTLTKIDAATGSAAVENGAGQLFSYAAVAPRQHRWHGRLVAPAGSDSALLEMILGLLTRGIVGLGKTHARLSIVGAPRRHVPASVTAGPPFAITLATAAALNDLDALRGGRPLLEDYASYWQAHGYRLLRFFASQRLEGGYAALRYPPKLGRCEPYLLTEPGSVFLIEPDGSGQTTPLADLLLYGLPPTAWIDRPDWQHCPFLPQNGFGQIHLNVVDHAALASGLRFVPREKAA